MSKKQKLIDRLKSKPKDFTFSEAANLLSALGFSMSIDPDNCLEYKGFYGSVEYCAESNLLHGEILGNPNLLSMYDGISLEELIADFKEAVDFHLLPREDGTVMKAPEYETV